MGNILAHLNNTKAIPGAILAFVLHGLLCHAHAKSSLDGEYVRLTNACWSNGVAKPEYECGKPIEEGVAIQNIKGSSFFVDIRTQGGNSHSCFYQGTGTLKNGVIETRSSKSDCGANIKVSGRTASLEQVGTCYDHCGARATLSASQLKKKKKSRKPRIER